MARLFDDASTQYLQIDSTPVTDYPLTMACWFYCDDDTIDQTVMWVGDKDAGDNYHQFFVNAPALNLRAHTRDAGGAALATTTTTFTLNTWRHGAAVFASSTDRRIFLDGGGKGTNATDVTPAGLDRITLAYMGDSSPALPYSGRLAEAAVWDVALTDAEVEILSKGYSPLFVRPQNLVAYWPLIRDTDDDIIGEYSMTPYNSPTVAPHPPVFMPTLPWVVHYTAAGIINLTATLTAQSTTPDDAILDVAIAAILGERGTLRGVLRGAYRGV